MARVDQVAAYNRNEAYADEIARMFAEGQSFRAMERATGVPKSTCEHMCKRLSADYVRERYSDRTAALGRELQLLDVLTRKNLRRAADGDTNSAKIVLDAHVRRSKLLGLDAAVQVGLTVRTAQDIEIERLMQMMTAESVPEEWGDPGVLADAEHGAEPSSGTGEDLL
jgi:hypothetical protein